MSKRHHRHFLEDILDAIEKIERYTQGLSREGLWSNDLVADAVVRNLEIIGEAARHVPQELRARHSDIDWRRVVGLRNVVVHEYFAVDLDVVWVVLNEHLPQLRRVVKAMLGDGAPS